MSTVKERRLSELEVLSRRAFGKSSDDIAMLSNRVKISFLEKFRLTSRFLIPIYGEELISNWKHIAQNCYPHLEDMERVSLEMLHGWSETAYYGSRAIETIVAAGFLLYEILK